MVATVPFIQVTFDRFNALCFEGALPAVPIVLSRAGSFLGKMEYKVRRDFFGNIVSCYDYRLKISTGFDLREEELEDVVIHEMIHYYISIKNIRDNSAHGDAFRRIMDCINNEYGRHITVRHRSKAGENLVREGSGKVRRHVLCISTFPDGKSGVTVCASTKLLELRRLLPKRYRISNMEWYGSLDPFFNRFPRSNTPKIYRISAEDLKEHLKDAVPLEWHGRDLDPVER